MGGCRCGAIPYTQKVSFLSFVSSLPLPAMPEPTYLHLTARTEQGILVLTITLEKLQGDSLADSLRKELLQAVAATGARSVILDLQPITYLSSAGFRPFLTLRPS